MSLCLTVRNNQTKLVNIPLLDKFLRYILKRPKQISFNNIKLLKNTENENENETPLIKCTYKGNTIPIEIESTENNEVICKPFSFVLRPDSNEDNDIDPIVNFSLEYPNDNVKQISFQMPNDLFGDESIPPIDYDMPYKSQSNNMSTLHFSINSEEIPEEIPEEKNEVVENNEEVINNEEEENNEKEEVTEDNEEIANNEEENNENEEAVEENNNEEEINNEEKENNEEEDISKKE